MELVGWKHPTPHLLATDAWIDTELLLPNNKGYADPCLELYFSVLICVSVAKKTVLVDAKKIDDVDHTACVIDQCRIEISDTTENFSVLVCVSVAKNLFLFMVKRLLMWSASYVLWSSIRWKHPAPLKINSG